MFSQNILSFCFLDYSDGNGEFSGGESDVEDHTQKEQIHVKNEVVSSKVENKVERNETCDTDHGCDHECYMIKYDYETHPIVEWYVIVSFT